MELSPEQQLDWECFIEEEHLHGPGRLMFLGVMLGRMLSLEVAVPFALKGLVKTTFAHNALVTALTDMQASGWEFRLVIPAPIAPASARRPVIHPCLKKAA